jgi:4-diphosphocytidyl-2C-methyl-D-erythritol kinase
MLAVAGKRRNGYHEYLVTLFKNVNNNKECKIKLVLSLIEFLKVV